MKSLLIALTLLCGSFAMSNEPAAQADTQAQTEVKAEKTEVVVAKLSKKQARKECLKENSALKSKSKRTELDACVKSKTM